MKKFKYGEIFINEDSYEIENVYNAKIITEREYEEGDYDNPTFMPIFSLKNLVVKIYNNENPLVIGGQYDISIVFEDNSFEIEFEESVIVKEYLQDSKTYLLKVNWGGVMRIIKVIRILLILILFSSVFYFKTEESKPIIKDVPYFKNS